MKVQTRVMEYESTVEGEKVGMTIDQSALTHIMSVLTDLYSDPELAVIREYATNAYDAHIEAGTKKPIEVTLPSPLSPFFKIRDYGLGLDADDIRDIYSRYGTSTKRESNDVVGMLGLGCKSALTYSDQFTITSTKDGRTIQVLVSRDEDGSGSMTIVSDGPAEGENGTEIIVPAKRVNGFEQKAQAFFAVWDEGTVLVNGEHPKRVDGLWLTDKLLLTQDVAEDCVVMGNVPYPWLDDEDGNYQYGDLYDRYHLVAFVAIGDVLFTPSREALQGTKQVKAKLASLRAETQASIGPAVQRLVTNAKTPAEAVAVATMGGHLGVRDEFKYQGRDVKLTFDRHPRDKDGNLIRTDPDESRDSFLLAGRAAHKVNGTRSWNLDPRADRYGGSMIVFYNFEAKQLSTTKREKLAQWAKDKGIDIYCRQVFVTKLSDDEKFWLSKDVKQYDWSVVEAVKIVNSKGEAVSGKLRGSYTARVSGKQMEIAASEIDQEAPIYWTHGNQYQLHGHEAIRNGVIDVDACTIVALPENRIEKFKRDFPTAVELDAGARKVAERWLASRDARIVDAFKFQQTWDAATNRLKTLDATKVDDPALSEAIRLAQTDTSAYREGIKTYGRWLGSVATESKRVNPLANYPLIAALTTGYASYDRLPNGGREHVYLYANAAYEAKQAEDNEQVAA